MNITNPSTINVKQLRESKNLTIRSVATALNVAESTINRWETGTVKPHLPLEKIEILLELFECDFPSLHAAFKQTALESQAAADDRAKKEKESLTVA